MHGGRPLSPSPAQACPMSLHHCPHPALQSALCSQGSLPAPRCAACMLRPALQLLPALACLCGVYCEPRASSRHPPSRVWGAHTVGPGQQLSPGCGAEQARPPGEPPHLLPWLPRPQGRRGPVSERGSRGGFAPQEMLGHAWRHCWLSQL